MSHAATAGPLDGGPPGPTVRSARQIGLFLSLAIALTVLAIYRLQPDALAFVTVFPVWCWWLPGVFLAAVAWRGGSGATRRLLVAVWLAVLWFSSDAPDALFRRAPGLPDESRTVDHRSSVRVVSFNTGSEPLGSSNELARWRPDIVLLQESYSRDVVAKLSRKLFGAAAGYVWSSDISILARGRVTAISGGAHADQPFLLAEVQIAGGPRLYVVNLRLTPQPVRLDFWMPDCWRMYSDLRRKHREQLSTVLRHCVPLADNAPLLIGGDFNAPAADAIFRLMRPRYGDVFQQAGCGWGCTLPNQLPTLRIDQLWANDRLRSNAVWSVMSERSDHRMVIGEFEIKRD